MKSTSVQGQVISLGGLAWEGVLARDYIRLVPSGETLLEAPHIDVQAPVDAARS